MKGLFRVLSNMSLLKQLVITFSVILIFNIILGIYFTTKIRDLKSLVEVMYDKPLMSSTYAMSAKYRFERVDSLVRTAFFEKDSLELQKLNKEITSQLEQGSEDLLVVQERAFATSSKDIARRVEAQVVEYKKVIDDYLEKVSALKDSNGPGSELILLRQYLAINIRNSIQKDLTDLTDDAAETGYTFRLDSESKNAETVLFFYAGSGTMLIIIIGLAFLLSRAIAKPLSGYSETCKFIAAGQYSKRVKVFGEKSEIAILGRAFNTMIDQIVEKDRNMRSLLDGLSSAVFSFDAKGEILFEKSNACQVVFDHYEFKNMTEFLKHFSEMDETAIQDSISILWDRNIEIDFDGLSGVLPTRIIWPKGSANPEKIIALNYKQNLNADGHLENVIVLADDITAAVEAEKNLIEQTERVERITKASLSSENYLESKTNFIQLIHECKEIAQKGISKWAESDLVQLKRQLHSLKGELAIMGHKSCAHQVHDIESALAEDSSVVQDEKLRSTMEKIEDEFLRQSNDVMAVLGFDESSKVIKVNIEKIHRLISDVKNQPLFSDVMKKELLAQLNGLLQKPLQSYFVKYEKYVQDTASKLGKKATLIFDSSSSEVTFLEVQSMDFILGHLLRNSLDHGIESAAHRENSGKSAVGQIKFGVYRQNQGPQLQFVISDDGQGIDHEKLIDKALKKQIWNDQQARSATRDQALQLIFQSDFSTKEMVTETSGRGVGLDAVRAEVEKLGGTIELETTIGHGTKFTIRIS